MNVETVCPPIPVDEPDRLAAVERYKLGGIGREPAFDKVTKFAATLFNVPISLVSVVGSEEQRFRGACGLDASGTSRDTAFCAFAILDPQVTVVSNAAEDPRFANNPLVLGEPFIRFYAGAPLQLDGHAVGTLCLIDNKPRDFGIADRKRLADLAQTVVDMIELRVDRFVNEEHQQRLREERELLKLTVENVTEGVALFDRDLRLILWNEGFVELLGYPPPLIKEGVQALKLVEYVARSGALGEGDPNEIAHALLAPIANTDSRALDLTAPDGRTLEFWRKTLADGRFITTVRDVTTEREMSLLKDELVSTVSHELRTPLSAIAGALGLLENAAQGQLSEKAERLLVLARKNSGRLIELVNDLLDMDKLRSGRMPFRFEQQDARELVIDAMQQNQPYADQHSVTFVLDAPEAPVLAPLDRTRMFQVLTNLMSNACKFSLPASQVHLALQQEQDAVIIRVSDKGPGISPEFRRRLFTRFAQEDGTHQSGKAGTGLGLAICKTIVEAHQGTIALDEKYEGGASFVVTLPLERENLHTGAG